MLQVAPPIPGAPLRRSDRQQQASAHLVRLVRAGRRPLAMRKHLPTRRPGVNSSLQLRAEPSMEWEDRMSDTSGESDVDAGPRTLTLLGRPDEWEFHRSGLLIDWRWPQVDAFVAVANSGRVRVARPVWLSQQKGTAITASAFVEDVMKLLECVAGGRPTPFELRPNTANQQFNVLKRLGGLEMDPFVASCMQEMPVEAGGLAGVMRLYANPDFPFSTEVVEMAGPADPGVRSVFL